ncbi:hypothetical protein [Methylobacter sp.]|uniref:hypothetical protein n=1 Tax=Methylobacter sp. TaxID=2051955 RepID=UPI0024887FFA|nr:hypothetical protein [Methylobacter sp.]MDI1357749.1 hypothetical protein [Methylobacter sp.]
MVWVERPFTIDAIVILPDHLHAVWTLPDGDADYSGRWRAIKSNFTHALRLSGMPLTPDKRSEYRLWQRFSLETEKTASGSIIVFCRRYPWSEIVVQSYELAFAIST